MIPTYPLLQEIETFGLFQKKNSGEGAREVVNMPLKLTLAYRSEWLEAVDMMDRLHPSRSNPPPDAPEMPMRAGHGRGTQRSKVPLFLPPHPPPSHTCTRTQAHTHTHTHTQTKRKRERTLWRGERQREGDGVRVRALRSTQKFCRPAAPSR